MRKLTNKQKRYVEEYVVDFNGTRAAIAAGYSEKTSRFIACENNQKPYIKRAIKKRLDEMNDMGNIKLEKSTYLRLLDYCNKDKAKANKIIDRLVLEYLPNEYLEESEYDDMFRRKNIDDNTRYTVLFRAGFKCQACGSKPNKSNDVVLHIDHIVPFSKGGSDSPNNLQVLCEKCNISKGNRYKINHNINWDNEENVQLKMIK